MSRGELTIRKVRTHDNLADALTKYVESSILDRHMRYVSLVVKVGRHRLAPENDINNVSHDVKRSIYHVKCNQETQRSFVCCQRSPSVFGVAMSSPSPNKMGAASVKGESATNEGQCYQKCDVCRTSCQVYKSCNIVMKDQ